jgi:acyl dehydratase
MTTVLNRNIVVLKLPLNVPALIKIGEAIVAAMTNNASFPAPVPPLATVTAALAKLDAAETATKTRAQGTVEARNAARVEVVQALHGLKGNVQLAADASPEQAATIIASAAMGLKQTASRNKTNFAAKPGTTTGSVQLVAKAAARRASYEWQWSADGGKNWTTSPSTLQARTTLAGIPSATVGQFRYRAVTKTGEGDWSQVVTLLVK